MKDSVSTIAGVVVAALVGGLVAFSISAATQKPAGTDVAKKVCDYSHNIDSGKWEESCSSALEAINAEYLCDGVEAGSHCWVRIK